MLTLKTPAPRRRGPLSTFSFGLIGAVLTALGAPQPASAASPPSLRTLYSFGANANDGCGGSGSLIFDGAGNLYGETAGGGSLGNGTLFSLFPGDSSDIVLHSFAGYNADNGTGGAAPQGSLIFDTAGNLYGTTSAGGKYGAGTVFKLAPDGTLKTLYNFTGGSDGGNPQAGLVADSAGNLYGTTEFGANTIQNGFYGPQSLGTIFRITPDTGALTTLYRFNGLSDGANPSSDLVLDPEGNLYGTTTAFGGSDPNQGTGTVFEFTTGGKLLTLYGFSGNESAPPVGGVIFDRAGNLYGTTYGNAYIDGGSVFKLAPSTGALTTLYRFKQQNDGGNPAADLIFDSAGNLYGTTSAPADGGISGGTVFRLSPGSNGQLISFETVASLPGPGSYSSNGGLMLDSAGTLYGTTASEDVNPAEEDGRTPTEPDAMTAGRCGIVYSLAGVAAHGPELTPSAKSITFEAVAIGSITLGNIQTIKIEVKGGNYIPKTPLLAGLYADEFSITSNSCTGIFASGGSCSITVEYTRNPGEHGNSAPNSIASLNLTGDATLYIPLTGKPTLTLLPRLKK